MKVFSSIVFVLIFASFASGAINEHISYVEFQKEWEYENAAAPNLSFHFHFDVAADSSVEHIELLTPGGNNVVMTSPEFDDESGSWLFEHTYETADQSNFEDYGEGIYQMTVFYYVGNPDLTSFLYSGLLQPTQEPVPVFPKPNQVVTSPVAFQWEPCLDSAASYIWFDVEDLEGNEVFDTIDQPTDAIGTGHIELDEGSYSARIGFENSQPYVNSDGIYVTRWKSSTIEWDFTVGNPAEIGLSVVGTKLPTAVVSGSGKAVLLTAWIENVGQEPFEIGAKADIYFYVRNIDTDQYTEIGRLAGKSISGLKPGKVKKYSVKAYLPVEVGGGNYEFEAFIGDDSAVLEDHTVGVQQGFVELSLAVGRVSLPSAVVAGQSAKTAIQVVVTNNGNIRTEKTAMADFVVIARPVGGGDDIVLDEKRVSYGNLKPGKAKKYSFKPTIPSSVPEDIYGIVVLSSYGEAEVELVLDNQIVVSEPFVDLECHVGFISGSKIIIPGSRVKIKIPITISNLGNVALGKSDTVDVEVYLRNESGNQSNILIGSSLNYKVGGLKSGKSKKLNMTVSVPATVLEDDYVYVVVVDSGNDLSESNEANNETVSDEVVFVTGGFMELTGFNRRTNATYSSTVRGNLLDIDFSGHLTVEVDNDFGRITETVISNDGFDTQEMTYSWYQNNQGIFLESFGQELDLATLRFDFDELVVFPADGSTGGQSADVFGVFDLDFIEIYLIGQATASGEIVGVKTVTINGKKYDAVEIKVSLVFDAKGDFEGGDGETYTIDLDVKQDMTYWTTSSGIIKSQIRTTVKASIPGITTVRASGSEVRVIVNIPD